MTYYTGLARVLRDAGLKVVEVDGWKTRGHGGMGAIQGILAHHTAGPHQSQTSSNYPSLGVVRDGRAGLPGPLAQLGIGFDGTWYVIAAGRAWHAGTVDDAKYGNNHALGIEAENPGDGSAWPQAQYDSYVRGVAALIAEWNGKIRVRGHKEAAIPHGRKIDPTFNMAQFRADVAKCDLGKDFKPSKGGKPAGGTTKPSKPKPKPKPYDDRDPKAGDKHEWWWHKLRVDGDFGPITKRAYQRLLDPAKVGDYNGIIDGKFGPLSVKAEQRWLHSLGYYTGRIDGDRGPMTISALQAFLYDKGLYRNGSYSKSVMVDADFGSRTIKGLQKYANRQRKYYR